MYYKLLEELAPLDRCHSGPEMVAAYNLLVESYPGSRILTFKQDNEINYWKVPPYWSCKAASLKDENGKVIASYKNNKLSLFTYSPSVKKVLSLEELQPHLFSDEERPNATCFYFRNQYRHWNPIWGFSIPHNIRENLTDKHRYEVSIDTNFDFSKPMIQSDYHHYGESNETYLFIGHFDHPGQVNDGLSGCIVAYEVIRRLKNKKTRFSYRAFSSVEIVGSVHYLESEYIKSSNIIEALFLGFVGISSSMVYQQSFRKNSLMDRIAIFLMSFFDNKSQYIFNHREIVGNDENIFDSVGYEIPCGTIMRNPFSEYHTEFDSMKITSKNKLEEVIEICLKIIKIIESNYYFSAVKMGVPCLSNPKIDLYLTPDLISGSRGNSNNDLDRIDWKLSDEEKNYLKKNPSLANQLMQNILRLSDGKHTIFDIAELSAVPFGFAFKYAELLVEKKIIILHEVMK